MFPKELWKEFRVRILILFLAVAANVTGIAGFMLLQADGMEYRTIGLILLVADLVLVVLFVRFVVRNSKPQ